MYSRALGFVVLLAGVLGLGCTNAWDDRRQELQRNRALWSSQGIHSYRYDFHRGCFCDSVARLPVVITVAGDTTIAVVDSATASPIPTARWPEYPTVDQLFSTMAVRLESESGSFAASYDPTLGYPRHVSSGSDIPDGGWGVVITVLAHE